MDSQVTLGAIRAPAKVVLKVLAWRPRTLFKHVVWYAVRTHWARSGARGERGLGPWDALEVVVVRRKGRIVRLVRSANSMSRYQLRHVS
jgi:hypothetical protein